MKFVLIPIFLAFLLLPGSALAQQATSTPQEEATPTPREEATTLPPEEATPIPQESIPAPVVDTVVKTICISTFAYSNLDAVKVDLLIQAKRAAVNELYGEFISALIKVEDFAVTNDQIRSFSSGFIRLGQESYYNSTNLAEVCVSIDAYTTAEDRAKFQPVPVSKRVCVNEPDLTIAEISKKAEETVLLQALIGYDRRLDNIHPETLLRLLRRVEYSESGFVSGTLSYCVTAQGEVTPVEVLALVEMDVIETTEAGESVSAFVSSVASATVVPTSTISKASSGAKTSGWEMFFYLSIFLIFIGGIIWGAWALISAIYRFITS